MYREEVLKLRGKRDGKVSPYRVKVRDSVSNTEEIKEYARNLNADLVGISKLHEDYVFEGYCLDHKYTISLAMRMSYRVMMSVPSRDFWNEVHRVYYEVSHTAVGLATHIRALGYSARAHFLHSEDLLHIPFAWLGGLGELGRHGMLITKEFGSCIRLSSVTTDIPLVLDRPINIGINSFCKECSLCSSFCTTGAIPREGQDISGVTKWAINPEKCTEAICKMYGCGICLKVCKQNAQALDPELRQEYASAMRKMV